MFCATFDGFVRFFEPVFLPPWLRVYFLKEIPDFAAGLFAGGGTGFITGHLRFFPDPLDRIKL